MSKKHFGILLLAVVWLSTALLVGLVVQEGRHSATEESQFIVSSTMLYTSTVRWSDGRTEVSYATGIITEEGSLIRLTGRYDFQPGAEYRLLTVPDAYSETWDQVLSIEQLTCPVEPYIPE